MHARNSSLLRTHHGLSGAEFSHFKCAVYLLSVVRMRMYAVSEGFIRIIGIGYIVVYGDCCMVVGGAEFTHS